MENSLMIFTPIEPTKINIIDRFLYRSLIKGHIYRDVLEKNKYNILRKKQVHVKDKKEKI